MILNRVLSRYYFCGFDTM